MYWNKINGNDIKSQKLANMIYDGSVNHGVGGIKRFVNDSLGIKSYDIAKINTSDPDWLFNEIGKKRKEWYNKRGGYAIESWLDRLKKLGYSGLEYMEGMKLATKIILAVGVISALGGGIYLLTKK